MRNIIFFGLLLCLPAWGYSAGTGDFPLPLDMDKSAVSPLRELVDAGFQQALEKRLFENKTWKKMVREKRLTVGLVDLSDVGHIMFARVNGNDMIYAASLPKIAVLLAAFHCWTNSDMRVYLDNFNSGNEHIS